MGLRQPSPVEQFSFALSYCCFDYLVPHFVTIKQHGTAINCSQWTERNNIWWGFESVGLCNLLKQLQTYGENQIPLFRNKIHVAGKPEK